MVFLLNSRNVLTVWYWLFFNIIQREKISFLDVKKNLIYVMPQYT
jgi:hypothetical protein